MPRHWTDKLVELEACEDAVTWAREFKTPQAAWDACGRGDWMTWLIERRQPAMTQGDTAHRHLVRMTMEIGRLSLPHADQYAERLESEVYAPLLRWCDGDDSIDLAAACSSAYAARSSADAACRSAYAAGRSAEAAQSSADAALSSADAAHISADAAYISADAAGSSAEAAQSSADAAIADIVRRYYPKPPKL